MWTISPLGAFQNTWYGPSDGITNASKQSPTDAAELKDALQKLRQYGNEVLKGSVQEGDEVDGRRPGSSTAR